MSQYIYICFKTFFYFAKQKDKRIKNNLDKKLSGENLPIAENSTCYANISYLLINSTANVVHSNFLPHDAVVNKQCKHKVNLGGKLHIRKEILELKLIDYQNFIGQTDRETENNRQTF